MSDEMNREENRYFNRVVALNQVSSLVSFLPPLFAVFVGIELTDFLFIFLAQIVILLLISLLKYRLEKKYREIEADIVKYVLRNTFSYAVISISIPVGFFLIDLFYRLTPTLRIILTNVLFFLGLLLLLSNLPASRILKNSEPLKDSSLLEQASSISNKLGTGDLQIYVINMDRFKIANAAQIGARKFFVFLSSYLLKNLTIEENVAVIAHEFAHASKRHVLKIVLISWTISVVAGNLLLFPIDSGMYPFLSYILPILGFLIIIGATMFGVPAIQRHFETEADLLATEIYDGEKLISALEKINKLNFTPGSLSVHWNMSHPATAQRIQRIREHKGKL